MSDRESTDIRERIGEDSAQHEKQVHRKKQEDNRRGRLRARSNGGGSDRISVARFSSGSQTATIGLNAARPGRIRREGEEGRKKGGMWEMKAEKGSEEKVEFERS